MLLGEPVEIGRRLPAERALVLPRPPPPQAGLEVVGALPAVLGAEDRAELLRSHVERAQPAPAARLARVERVAQAVVVLVDLARGLGGQHGVAVHPPEAPGAVGHDIDLGLAGGHPLRQRLAEPARAAEAVERQTGRDPEAAHAGQRAEQRVAVGRHRVRVAEQADDTRVLEEREPADGAFEQRREAIHVRLDRAGLVLPRARRPSNAPEGRARSRRRAGRRPPPCRRRGGRGRGSTARRAGSRARPPPASRRAGGRPARTGRTRRPSPRPAAPRCRLR